jgi:hypothetical protein
MTQKDFNFLSVPYMMWQQLKQHHKDFNRLLTEASRDVIVFDNSYMPINI